MPNGTQTICKHYITQTRSHIFCRSCMSERSLVYTDDTASHIIVLWLLRCALIGVSKWSVLGLTVCMCYVLAKYINISMVLYTSQEYAVLYSLFIDLWKWCTIYLASKLIWYKPRLVFFTVQVLLYILSDSYSCPVCITTVTVTGKHLML